MKLSDRIPDRLKRQSYLEDLTMMLFIVITAGMVSLIPLITVEVTDSANQIVPSGEAGLWSALGTKD